MIENNKIKLKLKEKVVALVDYSAGYLTVKKNDVFCLGEICYIDGKRETLLERHGEEYEIEFTTEELEIIYEYVTPLSLWRDKMIDEILNEI
jgi:hypothetical protein